MEYNRVPQRQKKKGRGPLFLILLVVGLMVATTVWMIHDEEATAPEGKDSPPPGEEEIAEQLPENDTPDDAADEEEEEPGGGRDEPTAENITYDPQDIDVDYLVDKLKFLENPMPGTVLTDQDSHLPGAPRPYREGIHKGLDFYPHAAGNIELGDPIYAAASGEVIRADHDYEKPPKEMLEELGQICGEIGRTPENFLDIFRGRQVWVEHEKGFVIRYCHLEDVNESLQEGEYIDSGTPIGTMGYSGTTSPEHPHLHLEIWFEQHYLGEGMSNEQIREFFEATLFDENS